MDIHSRKPISLRSQYMDSDKPNPLFIPEIILLVFEYIDPSLYRRLSEVCRLWRSVSHDLVWSNCCMDNRHLFEFLQRPRSHGKDVAAGDRPVREREGEETVVRPEQDGDPAIDESSFMKNSGLVKVLKFSEKSDLPAGYLASLKLPDSSTVFQLHNGVLDTWTVSRLCNSFSRLRTLVVRPSLSISQDKSVLSQYFGLIRFTISKCGELHTLDIKTSGSLLSSGMLHEIVRDDSLGRMTLQELRLACDFEGAELLIFQYLIEAVRKMIPISALRASGSLTIHDGIKATKLFCPNIRTLYLHDIQPVTATRRPTPFLQLLSQDVESVTRFTSLYLTSLTILNFHTGCRIRSFGIEPSNWQDYQSIDPLLAILRLCPCLTHLRVSYDITPASQPGPVGFSRMVQTLYPGHHTDTWGHVSDDFVLTFKELTPRLKNLDFGMRPHFHHRAWDRLMLRCGWRLETLSVWSALGFDAYALNLLVGHPQGHPHRLEFPHQLTRLDINGLDATAKSAWLVFQQIPSLKDFSARDVPLDASRLVGYDWVCTGLQSLAIYVAVPKEPAKEGKTWTWIEKNLEWEETCEIPLAVASVNGQGQQKMQAVKQDQIKPAQQQQQQQQRRHDYSTRLQIQVCEQLGRLTDLRKLILEGGGARVDGGDGVMPAGYESMKLTLETGLDRLAPLKRRLETLIVYQLEEQLCGRKEMEWIARYWVHHNNPHWLQTHTPGAQQHMTSRSRSTLITDECNSSPAASYIVPAPTFEALLGISVKNTNTGERVPETRAVRKAEAARISSLKWFREECPTVLVKTFEE
ncbi:hypothetical protein BGZ99_007275 [Dissophora globulifera]|uniref:F-box domain-containing protein n=1 Tax=Dissophora globulifera TaxID=979702 RepID=A0A9P6UR61_9FUNG|nr:hypothetical protein BGZ99_007275 [Dissophora globulifera]